MSDRPVSAHLPASDHPICQDADHGYSLLAHQYRFPGDLT